MSTKLILPTDPTERRTALAGLHAGQTGKEGTEHPCPILEPARGLYLAWHKVGAAMLQFEPHRQANRQGGTMLEETVNAEKDRMRQARRLPGD